MSVQPAQEPVHLVIRQGATTRFAVIASSAGADVDTTGWAARMMMRPGDYEQPRLTYLRTNTPSPHGRLAFAGTVLLGVLYPSFTAALPGFSDGVFDVELILPPGEGESEPTVLRPMFGTYEVDREVTRDDPIDPVETVTA